MDGGGEQSGFLREFLRVVFAEIAVVVREVVEGEDVVGGFEFGDGYETDLWVGWGGKFGGEVRVVFGSVPRGRRRLSRCVA